MTENITQLTTELEQSKTREHLLGKELRTLQVIDNATPSIKIFVMAWTNNASYYYLNHWHIPTISNLFLSFIFRKRIQASMGAQIQPQIRAKLHQSN